MTAYLFITILSFCVGAGFSYIYFLFENNPIIISALIILPIIIGYLNTSLDVNTPTIKKFIMNFTNILLSYILTGLTAMAVSKWI